MKGKTKAQKGITLVALIITIVVLLILASVAISSIQNSEILSHAQNAAKDYNQFQEYEQSMLNQYLGTLIGIKKAIVGTKTTSISTIDGKEYSSTNPIIPAGFMPINTGTSSWDAEDLAAEVKKGLVISDGTSEFVWIPVADLNSFARLQEGSDTNYRGVLYDWVTDVSGATEYEWTSIYREPANLTATGGYADTADRFTIASIKSAWDADYYQESFNKMVESVAKYKGFYVGRYEMSINATSGKAESTAGATSADNSSSSANMWWGLYEKATTYSTSGVISEMIWGCQYDAIMKWMKSNNIDITSETPTDTSRGVVASYNTTRVTGSVDSNDILNNIYDILGNSYEWTQEAKGDGSRTNRGGNCNNNYYPGSRFIDNPQSTAAYRGTRITLYVEQ